MRGCVHTHTHTHTHTHRKRELHQLFIPKHARLHTSIWLQSKTAINVWRAVPPDKSWQVMNANSSHAVRNPCYCSYVLEFRSTVTRRSDATIQRRCYDPVADKYSWLARHEGLAPGRIINDLTLGTHLLALMHGTPASLCSSLFHSHSLYAVENTLPVSAPRRRVPFHDQPCTLEFSLRRRREKNVTG